jgi:hypothetical protein
MSDVLDQLRGLRVGRGGAPEPVDGLRERIAVRRRRRRRLAAGGLSVVVVTATAVLAVVDDEGERSVRTVNDPTTVPSTAVPAPTSPLPVGAVVASAAGIEQVAESGRLVSLSEQPTARAFAISDIVVAQSAELVNGPLPPHGPVLILDSGGQRTLPAEPGEELTLHDVGLVAGRAVAVVTARSGVGPDDSDDRLLLFDLQTGSRRDLGSVGGWESGVNQARLVGDRIVTLEAVSVDQRVVARSLDGAVVWEAAEPVADGNVAIAVDGNEVLQLEPTFVGDDFEPQLDITWYDLSGGAPVATERLALQLPTGLEIENGFCHSADASAGRIICDQSIGPPIEIDLDTGETTLITGVDHGVPALPRQRFSRTVGSTDGPAGD